MKLAGNRKQRRKQLKDINASRFYQLDKNDGVIKGAFGIKYPDRLFWGNPTIYKTSKEESELYTKEVLSNIYNDWFSSQLKSQIKERQEKGLL